MGYANPIGAKGAGDGLMRFTIKGEIVPAVRMTRKSKWVNPRAARYLDSKGSVAWQYEAQMAMNDWAMLPGQTPLSVHIEFGYCKHNQDIDNLAKAMLDAANGIVWPDDRWIDALDVVRLDTGIARTVVEVEVKGEQ